MIRLLFVSPSPAAVRPFERHLRSFGCQYELASSGIEALDRLHAAEFDGVVVADHKGASSGILREVVRAVRSVHPRQIVVALTPRDSTEHLGALMENGASSVLPSDCTPSQFVARLMAVILPG